MSGTPTIGAPHRDTSTGLPDAFRRLAESMDTMSAPMYAAICRAVAADLDGGGICASILTGDQAARVGDMVPLRLLSAVHRLVLRRQAPALATFYPDAGGTAPVPGPAGDPARAMAAAAFLAVLREHADEVRDGMAAIPQTNETGRAAALMGLLRLVHDAWGLPVDLREIGASAGLNLRADAYRIEPVGLGPGGSPLVVGGAWDPADPWAPPAGAVHVASREGCDLDPVDPTTTAGRLHLTSYLWPEHPWRFERLRAALAVADQVPATVVRAPARAYARSLRRTPGRALVLWHSAMWMYPSRDERAAILAGIADLAAGAGPRDPVVHAAFEPVGDDPHDFHLVVASWPGLGGRPAGQRVRLANGPPHGVPLTWCEPTLSTL